jgi:predicted RNA-binding Zn-ribbon protein involved in translation (DUF1610 family)
MLSEPLPPKYKCPKCGITSMCLGIVIDQVSRYNPESLICLECEFVGTVEAFTPKKEN